MIPGCLDYLIASDTIVDLKLQIFDDKGKPLAVSRLECAGKGLGRKRGVGWLEAME